MVTKLIIANDPNKQKSIRIIDSFEDQTGLDLMDHCLIKVSPCKKYESVYVFLKKENLNTLINLVLEEEITIYSKKDYTQVLSEKIKKGKLSKFKDSFTFEGDSNSKFSNIIERAIPRELVVKKIAQEAVDSFILS